MLGIALYSKGIIKGEATSYLKCQNVCRENLLATQKEASLPFLGGTKRPPTYVYDGGHVL